MRLPGVSPKVMESACSVPSAKRVRVERGERGASGSISRCDFAVLDEVREEPGRVYVGRLAISFPQVSLKLSIVPAKPR
jgi:hypothetical protein